MHAFCPFSLSSMTLRPLSLCTPPYELTSRFVVPQCCCSVCLCVCVCVCMCVCVCAYLSIVVPAAVILASFVVYGNFPSTLQVFGTTISLCGRREAIAAVVCMRTCTHVHACVRTCVGTSCVPFHPLCCSSLCATFLFSCTSQVSAGTLI
jgi:hypothetical protein